MKAAAVYWRKDRYFVHASSQTTDGVWIFWAPVFAVTAEEGAAALGRKIAEALDASRTGVPHPREWKGLVNPLLALAGVKSWPAFCKGAECVDVSEEGGRVTLVPMRNLGPKEGFEPLTNPAFATLGDPDELGALTAEILRTAQQRGN